MKRASKMTAWPNEDETDGGHIGRLVDALFDELAPLAERSLSNKDIRADFPNVVIVRQTAQQALSGMLAAQAAHRCYELTDALYAFGRAYQGQYRALKTQRGLLDYDDLIRLTNNMLADGDAAQWVGWKLDNGIRHMLPTRRRTPVRAMAASAAA